jgi:phosphoesterase RecJ-like protein
MRNLQSFKELLASPKKIVITTHYKPDADALGSSLGLAAFLKKMHHQVKVITPTDYPQFLNWMNGHEEVVVYSEENAKLAASLVAEADMIFCLDFNNLDRIDKLGDEVAKAQAVKVLIDHHLEPQKFADFELWSTSAAATAELIYELINLIDERSLIDAAIADCLYAGLMTDTGQFKHSNTTKNVHLVVADLIELGANTTKVGEMIYDNNSVNRLKFIGFALCEKLEVLPEYNTAYFTIEAKELKKFNSQTGDTEGLVNYALSLNDIIFAAVIIDREGERKISFRSKGDFSVNEFARLYFEGGGHRNAAGGRSDLPIDEVRRKFEEVLPKYKNLLNETNKKVKQKK